MIISHDQLTLRHHKLLDRALVAGGEVSSPHLHLHLERKIIFIVFLWRKISHLAFLPQQKVPPLTSGDHLAVPQLHKRLNVGDGLVVEHPAGHVHLDSARCCHDSPEVDVPVSAVHDQGEGDVLVDAFNTWW